MVRNFALFTQNEFPDVPWWRLPVIQKQQIVGLNRDRDIVR